MIAWNLHEREKERDGEKIGEGDKQRAKVRESLDRQSVICGWEFVFERISFFYENIRCFPPILRYFSQNIVKFYQFVCVRVNS